MNGARARANGARLIPEELDMPTWAWILIAVVVLAIVAAAVYAGMNRRKSTNLKQRYGPEYDRAVDRHGDRKDAERDLAERQSRRQELDIHPLPAEDRRRYAARWESVQAAFVDHPHAATAEADALITDVLKQRGYPVDRFDDAADLVSTDHPDVVEHYRASHAIAQQGHSADTESLRQAFVHFRALFDRQLGDAPAADDRESRTETTTGATSERRHPEGGHTA
jgi:hypothetical protein